MSEEEKKAIEIVKHFNKENIFRDCGRINNAIDTVITLAEKLEQEKEKNKKIEDKIKENEKLKEIIFNIRHKLKGKVITKNDNIYAPAKNLSKQEVYQTFVDISLYLKANYIFKDDETVIQELLEEEE